MKKQYRHELKILLQQSENWCLGDIIIIIIIIFIIILLLLLLEIYLPYVRIKFAASFS